MNNRAKVLALLREEGPVSRSDIAGRMGLSLPAVSAIVADFIRDELAKEVGSGRSSGGRKPRLLEFNPAAGLVIGVDLGGSKVAAALADLAGEIKARSSRSTDVSDAESVYVGLRRTIDDLLREAEVPSGRLRGIGVGAPGVVDPAGGRVSFAPNLPRWHGYPLRERLRLDYGVPVFVDNDVNLATLGEKWFGAGRGVRDFIMVSVGTGIGAGIVAGDRLLRGYNHAAGEVGYMLLGRENLGAYFGGHGCLENAPDARPGASDVRPDPPGARAVLDAARRGDRQMRRAVSEVMTDLGIAVANMVCLLNPQRVIIGGGVAQGGELILEPICRVVESVAPFAPEVVASPLGLEAGLLGAVGLAARAVVEQLATGKAERGAVGDRRERRQRYGVETPPMADH